MTLPSTYKGTPVVLWTPEGGQAFLTAQAAFTAAHPEAHEYDPGVVYCNAEGAIVSPNVGLPIGGNVTMTDEEMASVNAAQEAVNEAAAAAPTAPATIYDGPVVRDEQGAPYVHISLYLRLVTALKHGEQLAAEELAQIEGFIAKHL